MPDTVDFAHQQHAVFFQIPQGFRHATAGFGIQSVLPQQAQPLVGPQTEPVAVIRLGVNGAGPSEFVAQRHASGGFGAGEGGGGGAVSVAGQLGNQRLHFAADEAGLGELGLTLLFPRLSSCLVPAWDML